MSLNPRSKRPIGRQLPTPRRNTRTPAPAGPLPLAQDGGSAPIKTTAAEPDPVMVQAKRDIDAGMVDTDMRATPGLDAERRARLVPGPGGKPPQTRA
jgi:hypothetical protein